MKTVDRLPSIFISHGMIGETLNPAKDMNKFFFKYSKDNKLQERVETAILISGHWEENEVTINMNKAPQIIHDHPCSWLFKYNSKFDTDIELASKIKKRLEENKIVVKTSKNQEVDHGAWGGLFCLYDIKEWQNKYDQTKEQHVPKIVQISLHSGMDTEFHYKLGQIIDEFRNEKVMIISSGATSHSFTNMGHPLYPKWSQEWETWLISVVNNKDIQIRKKELLNIKKNKMYPIIHHSDDHFIPLLVSLGTSPKEGELLWIEKYKMFWGTCYVFH